MPIRDLDSDQKFVGTSQADEIAVSSGAGSGKTRVLAGRYLHLLNSGQGSLSEMAAITFTNKAADQMKARIAGKALELAVLYPDSSAKWREAAEKIYTAPISTIHAFCNTILRSYPVQAGVDPQFEILDDTASSRLRVEALSAFLKIRYDEDPERMVFLLRSLGSPGLRKIFLQLLSMRARVVKWLDVHGVPNPELLRSRTGQYIMKRLEGYVASIRDFHAVRPGDDSLSLMLPDMLNGAENILEMMKSGRVDDGYISSFIETTRKNLPRLGKNIKDAWSGREARAEGVKDGMGEFLSFLEMTVEYNCSEADITPKLVSYLIQEYMKLEEFFLWEKKSRSCLDHDDSLIETWRLLRNNPDVCGKVSGSFRHILVDEFQDTDSLQLDILRMISGNSSVKLFIVGDPKQSIYRFRGADVTVFNDFIAGSSVDFKSLKENYRSTPAIIDFVNHTFGRIMGRDDPEKRFEVIYSDMKAHRKRNDPSSPVEIVVFDIGKADMRRMKEGEYIALRARELSETYGYSYSQMALLLRKGTQTKRYEETFLRHGIPFVNLAGGNPFASPEAYDIANLLGWLADPHDQVLFSAVLLSPFCGLDADFLYGLRMLAGKEGSLSDIFLERDISKEQWAQGKDAPHVREILSGLLSLRDRKTIRELLEKVFDETGYTLALLADPLRGEMSLAILDFILKTADNFEEQGGRLSEFAGLIRDGELAADSSELMENPGDSLSIITIHKAKGMEYKVVFLADCSSKTRNDVHPFLFHDELGPGFSYRSPTGKMVRMMTSEIASELEKSKAVAESKRLFYVACTRAEDHLIITGGNPSKNEDRRYEKDNWMSWLHSALSLAPESGPQEGCPQNLFSFRIIREEDTTTAEFRSNQWSPILDAVKDIPVSELAEDHLFCPVSPIRYPGRPVTLSPTQIVDYIKCPALYLFKHVYKLDSKSPDERGEGLGYRYGLLAHRVLERWDYRERCKLIAGVDNLSEPDIPQDLRENLKAHLDRFTASDLYNVIAGSEEIRKEEPFAFLQEGVLVRGQMDLRIRTGSRITVIDFKTDYGGEEGGENLLHRYKIQMGLYALGVRNAEDIVPSRLVLHFLSQGVSRDFPCSEETIDSISHLLSETIKSLDKGDFGPNRTERCPFCPWLSLCRIYFG